MEGGGEWHAGREAGRQRLSPSSEDSSPGLASSRLCVREGKREHEEAMGEKMEEAEMDVVKEYEQEEEKKEEKKNEETKKRRKRENKESCVVGGGHISVRVTEANRFR